MTTQRAKWRVGMRASRLALPLRSVPRILRMAAAWVAPSLPPPAMGERTVSANGWLRFSMLHSLSAGAVSHGYRHGNTTTTHVQRWLLDGAPHWPPDLRQWLLTVRL